MQGQWVVLGGLVAGIWVVLLWLAIIVWTYRDIRTRTRDPLLQILAIFLVLMFFIPGLALYLLLRPQETLEEAYARSLEEEALLREIGEEGACPSCRRSVERDFLVCPFCQTRLKEQCSSCEQLLSFSWIACPYCGTARPSMLEGEEGLMPAEPAQASAPLPSRRGAAPESAQMDAGPGAGAEAVEAVPANEQEPGGAEVAPYQH